MNDLERRFMPRPPLYPNRPDKHCPDCEIEYTERATVCSECGGELAWGALPDAVPPLAFSNDLVSIAEGETLLMKALVEELNDEGIRHHLAPAEDPLRFVDKNGIPFGYDFQRGFVGVDPYSIQSWALSVRPEDEDAARQLVARSDAWMDEDYVAGVLDEARQSSASSWLTRRSVQRLALFLIGMGFLGGLLFRQAPLPTRGAQDIAVGLAQIALWLGISLEVGLLVNALSRWNDRRMKRALD